MKTFTLVTLLRPVPFNVCVDYDLEENTPYFTDTVITDLATGDVTDVTPHERAFIEQFIRGQHED